jgi:outer membrane murein-binding lipoprotein Lpp
MNETEILLIILAVFTGVAALALMIQAGLLLAIYKVSRQMQAKVERLAPHIEELAPRIQAMAEDYLALAKEGKAQIHEIGAKVQELGEKSGEILDSTRRQVARVEELVNDFVGRAQNQLDRAEMVADDVMSRAQETIALVHGGIMKPVREINGVASGVRAAIRYFMRGGRPNPDRATADEEMFI